MNSGSSLIVLCFIGSAFAATIPISPQVVNGTNAHIAEFPFMASLRRNSAHSCGATILNDWWLLTAAHCITNTNVASYSVQYANTIISREGTDNVVEVELLILHEGYLPSNQYINDIGLVKVKQPIQNSLYDYRVRLPMAGGYFSTGTPSVLA